MDVVVQILIGLIIIYLGFLVGRAWRYSRTLRPYWRAWRFWRPFLSGDMKIVMDKFNEFNEWEASGLVGVGGMEAAIGTVKLFDDWGLRNLGHSIDLVYHDQADGHLYESNLVCIGGPDANNVTDLILDKVDRTIILGVPEKHYFTFIDIETDEKYGPSPDLDCQESTHVTFDHGVVIKAQSPFARRKYVLILAGNYGYGTWAAVKLLRSPQFLHHPYVKLGLNIECLFRTEVIKGIPQEPEIIVVREIFTRHAGEEPTDHT